MKISSHYVEQSVLDKRESASLAASIEYLKIVLSSDARNVMQLGTCGGSRCHTSAGGVGKSALTIQLVQNQ